jgi:hypothetical protein
MSKDINGRFEDFLKQVGVTFSNSDPLLKAYESGLNERMKLKDKFLKSYRPTFPLRPSSALTCGRKLYYELDNFYEPGKHPTEPTDIRMSRVFKAGDIFEEYELSQIESLHNLKITHRQHRLAIATVGGEQITGSIDALVWLKGKPYLLDIKTSSTYQFRDIDKKTAPKLSNVAQLSLYATSPGMAELMTSLGFEGLIPDCVLMYINKDSLQYSFIEFTPNKKLAQSLVKRFEKIYNLRAEGQVPPRDFAKTTDYPCGRYCAFFELCQGKNDPALNIQLDKDPDVGQEEEELLLDLWQFGDSSSYESPGYRFAVTKFKTKWSVAVTEKEKVEVVEEKADEKKSRRKTNRKAK